MSDLRYAIRTLRKQPGFTAVAVLMLALGIGANTAVFSVVDKVLIRPLPFADADQRVEIREFRGEQRLGGVSPPIYVELKGLTNVFQDLIAYEWKELGDYSGDYPEQIAGAEVTPDFFNWLQAHANQGRTFLPEEGRRGNERYIVLSHRLWEERYGADPSLIGRTLKFAPFLDAKPQPYTVIGVMRPGFRFPGTSEGGPAFWVADDLTTYDYSAKHAWQYYAQKNWTVAARLAPGVSREQAQTVLNTVALRHQDKGRSLNRDMSIHLRPFSHAFAEEGVAQTMWGLTAAIVFVLLIVCANVSSLQLTRAEARQKELAIRTAMGASHRRLLGQLLIENLVLAIMGGGLGILAGWWGITVLAKFMPAGLPRLNDIGMDARVLGFSLGLTVLSGLLFGLAPSWRPRSIRLATSLKEGGHTSHIGAGRQWVRHALVASQVALAIGLLAGAGLMIQSVARLLRVDPGFNPEHLLTVGVFHMEKHESGRGIVPMSAERYRAFLGEMKGQFESIPGIERIAPVIMEGREFYSDTDTRPRMAGVHQIGTRDLDYFRTKGIHLLRGRWFGPADESAGAASIIASESMVREFWPGTDGLNQRLHSRDRKKTFHVVGVVPDVRDYELDRAPGPLFYEPIQRAERMSFTTFVVRTRMDAASAVPGIRSRLWDAEKDALSIRFGVVEDQLIQSTKARRTYMWIVCGFAAVGLLLAAIGIYGVLAYNVARRTQEFGIRMALGAQRGDLLRLVVSQGMAVVLFGMVAGLVVAHGLTRFLTSQLFQVAPTDPWVLGSVVLLMAVAALAACFIPARRACRLSPLQALRYE